MSCCKSCSEGAPCEGVAPAGVIIPTDDPPEVIESGCGCGDDSGTVHFTLVPGEPQKVAWRLALNGEVSIEQVSQAYELGPCNAVYVVLAVIARSGIGGIVLATLEGSLDKAWWEPTGSTVQLNAMGRFVLRAAALTWKYVRVRYDPIIAPIGQYLSVTIVGTCDVP